MGDPLACEQFIRRRLETPVTVIPNIRVENCAFLVANATKNLALATRISQLVAYIFSFGKKKKRSVASWCLPKKVNFRP